MPPEVVAGPTPVGRADQRAEAHRATVALVGLAAATLAVVALFLAYDLRGSLSFALELRARRLGGLALVGVALATSTVLFHTVTGNRVLTPGLIGFDSLYLLLQVSAAHLLGTFAFLRIDVRVRFLVEVLVMLGLAAVVHRAVLARHATDLHLLVLVGVVLGTICSSLTAFVSRLIDPNEYLTLQDQLFASFASVDADLLGVSAVLVAAVVAWVARAAPTLDAVALGRDVAVSLGVDHRRVVDRSMACIAVLVSVATALVGPVTFLGLLAANLAYRLTGTFRHRATLWAASLLAVTGLVGGQLVLERVLRSSTRLGIVIAFLGGTYFLWLVVREGDR